MAFTFELCLGGNVVKRIVFASDTGRRDIKSSGGQTVGKLILTKRGLRLEMVESAANTIADAQFH